MSVTYSSYFFDPSGPKGADSISSENPMIALRGVRSSCDMLARNSDFAWLAASARSVSFMYFLLSSESSRARSSSALRARLRSWIVAISRRSLSTSFS